MVLDTNHLSVLEWDYSPSAIKILEKMDTFQSHEIGTTIVNFEEQMRGWMALLNDHRKVKNQIEGYRRLRKQLRLYCAVNILEFDEQAAVEFQRLKNERLGIGSLDLKIAAIVLANRGVLITANLKDFRQISGLQVENWL